MEKKEAPFAVISLDKPSTREVSVLPGFLMPAPLGQDLSALPDVPHPRQSSAPSHEAWILRVPFVEAFIAAGKVVTILATLLRARE